MKNKYQNNYSELYENDDTGNESCREIKAQKTISIIQEAMQLPLKELRVLEVGCFKGFISGHLAPHFADYTGIDLESKAVEAARVHCAALPQVHFEVMNAEDLTFKSQSFDLVICSHVYEHVPHPELMMNEIYRVLKPGGICYFAAGNRLVVREPHHRILFLSWWPKSIAHWILRLRKRGDFFYETHFFLPQLKKLVCKFERTDYSMKIIKEPVKYRAEDMIQPGSFKQVLAIKLFGTLYFMLPTFIWILRKPINKP